MEHVALFLANGFEEIEALTPVDVLRRAGIDVTTVSISNSLEVTGAHHITVKADILFNDMNYADYSCAVLPGGMPGAKHLKEHQKLNDMLIQFARDNKLIGAICAAPMVPGALGLTKNKKATCYPGFEDQLTEAICQNVNTVLDGQLLTAKAAGAAMQFAFRLVEILSGKDKAIEVAGKMFVDYEG